MRRNNDAFQGGFLSFNPRTPYGVRLLSVDNIKRITAFQSTHSLRSATCFFRPGDAGLTVSIHALLTECDLRCLGRTSGRRCFNPRTPYGVRPTVSGSDQWSAMFQSTHSLRSATIGVEAEDMAEEVSIHALLTECDPPTSPLTASSSSFNPRTPYGVRPARKTQALRYLTCFNPRTPYGVRLFDVPAPRIEIRFQSTHSLRSATLTGGFAACPSGFQSTHSLRSAT